MMAKCSLIPPGFFAIDSKKSLVTMATVDRWGW